MLRLCPRRREQGAGVLEATYELGGNLGTVRCARCPCMPQRRNGRVRVFDGSGHEGCERGLRLRETRDVAREHGVGLGAVTGQVLLED